MQFEPETLVEQALHHEKHIGISSRGWEFGVNVEARIVHPVRPFEQVIAAIRDAVRHTDHTLERDVFNDQASRGPLDAIDTSVRIIDFDRCDLKCGPIIAGLPEQCVYPGNEKQSDGHEVSTGKHERPRLRVVYWPDQTLFE